MHRYACDMHKIYNHIHAIHTHTYHTYTDPLLCVYVSCMYCLIIHTHLALIPMCFFACICMYDLYLQVCACICMYVPV